MDIYAELRKAFDLFGLKIDTVELNLNREKLPEAGYMPESVNGHSVFVLSYNKPALMRLALIEIVLHETTHAVLRDMGYRNWKEHDEMFWKTYAELRKKYEHEVAKIYGR